MEWVITTSKGSVKGEKPGKRWKRQRTVNLCLWRRIWDLEKRVDDLEGVVARLEQRDERETGGRTKCGRRKLEGVDVEVGVPTGGVGS